ncbi:MAG TPA: hypothetical protein VMS54_13090 [Vicinamibacterales bacterium]|nr:hypothetical protein [Vicinamibacterales bacterium]
MKKKLLSGVMAVVMVALAGMSSTGLAAQQASKLWSVAVNLRYANGDIYDYVIARGLETQEMSSMLAECGKSHWTGTVVWYHCYPIPE